MKIIYEFDTADESYDEGEYLVIKNAYEMYSALFNIDSILRKYRKEAEPFDFDKIDQEIVEEIITSKINEIP